MKWNWGTRLAIFALAFMIFVVTMVVIISRQDVPLVEENYYEKGLKYQQEIDNQSAIDSTVTLDRINGNIRVFNHSEQGLKGKLSYYRPSDKTLDIEMEESEIKPGTAGIYSTEELKPGKWKTRFTWEKEGKTYYRELEFER